MIGLWLRKLLAEGLADIEAASAASVAARAIELAPKKSGALAGSIEAAGGTVTVAAPYALALEADQPFLRPALAEERLPFMNRLRQRIMEGQP